MVINVGINGFGRIGRVIFRTCVQHKELQLTAVNDPAITADYICYLIKFDSTHGKFNDDVSYSNDQIIVNGQTIKVCHEKLPSSIPWHELGVQYVIEASGMFTNLEKASGHLASGSVKRVLVTSPSVDIPMIVLGVNCKKLNPEIKVVSCASSTLYCLAPIMKVLEDNYGVSEGFITSIHAMTPSLKPLDGLCLRGKVWATPFLLLHQHWRDHRSIHQNIIPAATGACKALSKIIPSLKDKTAGMAFRVPIVNVSVLDITVRLIKNTSLANICKRVENAGKTTLKNIIKISNEEAVSSDFIGEDHSCILDMNSCLQINPNFFKLVCWYENEYSYACRVINTIFFSEYQNQVANLVPRSTKLVAESTVDNNDQGTYTNLRRDNDIISVCSTSADRKNKTPIPTLLSTVNSPRSKKRNEVFRVVSDNDSNLTKSTNGSKKANDNNKPSSITKERLENVKKEFTKMISITEDLLRKTQSNKLKLQELENGDVMKYASDRKFRMNNDKPEEATLQLKPCVLKCKTIFDVSGDFSKSTVESRNIDCSKEQTNTTETEPSEFNEESKLQYNRASFSVTSDKSRINKNYSIKVKAKQDYAQSENTVTNEYAKPKDSHCDERSLTYKDQSEMNETEVKFNKLYEPISQGSFGKFIFSVRDSINSKHENISSVKSLFKQAPENTAIYSHNYGNDVVCVNKTIKAQKIRLFNKSDDSSIDIKKLSSRDLVCNMRTKSTISNEVVDAQSSRSFFCGVNAIFITPKHFPTPKLLQNKLSNLKSRRNKEALFDKLDSVSNSGSESSVQRFETKSQVINLIDLTSSLDDLDRLDKICRIIEISDELSDKLLSNINTNSGCAQAKKWSFKDLCEKIKLDDFCNNLLTKRD